MSDEFERPEWGICYRESAGFLKGTRKVSVYTGDDEKLKGKEKVHKKDSSTIIRRK
jgi:hypothetical protein